MPDDKNQIQAFTITVLEENLAKAIALRDRRISNLDAVKQHVKDLQAAIAGAP